MATSTASQHGSSNATTWHAVRRWSSRDQREPPPLTGTIDVGMIPVLWPRHPVQTRTGLNPRRRRSAICSMPTGRRHPSRRRTGSDWSSRSLEVTSLRCMRSTSRRIDRSEEHTSELQSRLHLVCRLLLEKKKKTGPHRRARDILFDGAPLLVADRPACTASTPAAPSPLPDPDPPARDHADYAARPAAAQS